MKNVTPLDQATAALGAQNILVGRRRNEYLKLEAERKTFESRLVKAAAGKSHAERLVNAQATEEWLVFHQKLARAEAIYEFERFKLEILDKEWLAQYSSQKLDEKAIRRGVG